MRVVSTLSVLLLLASVPATGILVAFSSWVSIILFGTPAFSEPVKIAALVIFLQNMTVPGFSWLRVENKAAFFSILSIANLLTTLSMNLVLVGIFHLGLIGPLLAVGSGYGIVVLCTMPVVLVRARVLPRLDIAWNLLSFGLPLVSSFISVWILQLSDRYLLDRLGSLAQTGSYSVAYTLGGVMGAVVLAPFSLAWPTAMFTIAKRKDAAILFRIVFRWYGLALLFFTFTFSVVSTVALVLFFPPSYHSAAPIVPIIAVSLMLYGIFDIFTIGIGVKRKTWYAVVFTAFSALVNIGCNLLLIPHFGSMGAAWSTLIAYALLAVVAYIVNQVIYPIPFEIGKITLALVFGVSLYLCISLITQRMPLIAQVAIFMVALIVYGVVLVLMGNPFAFIRAFLKKRGRLLGSERKSLYEKSI